ncbi:asparaginase [Bacilliculturomica massiliensis]|uniref:asparaginase n=1 Tax=Bacilliculturomica massiliensis TaxID=1917867 RepID=UPI001031CB13|nr:asparaginase [Bacilliculturomica massiliensis]
MSYFSSKEKQSPKHVRVMLLGGTIACRLKDNGESETVDIEDFIHSFCDFDGKIRVSVNSFSKLGGYDTRISDLLNVAEELKRTVREDDVDGIVVVMGTNVMEEAAFAVNLMVQTEIPIVFTGAMRIPQAKGADGPVNVVDAITAAASDSCRDLGVIVVFNNEIHSADYMRKEHTLNCGAITSDFRLGYVAEGAVSIRTRPVRRRMPWIHIKTPPKEVLLYQSYLGDTGKLLDYVEEAGYEGAVIEGTGGGYCALWVFDKIEKLHKSMPVVMASRIGHGDTMTATYGNEYGMPGYFSTHGYLSAGQLDGRKARILLTVLLMSECSEEQIAESFRMFSKDE